MIVFLPAPPQFPFTLPVCFEWKEGQPLPEGLIFVKGPLEKDMYLKICLTQLSPPKVTVEKSNIAEIDVDIRGSLKWVFKHMAMRPEWQREIPKPPEEWGREKSDEVIRYVKSLHDRFDIEITSDLPEEKICLTLPTEWRFKGILKNNAPIPFTITDTNKICFTVKHASPTLITLELISDATQTTQTISTSMSTLLATAMLLVVMGWLLRGEK